MSRSAHLPERPLPPMLLRGFAPLGLLLVLIALVIALAPSTAPEHFVPDTTVTTPVVVPEVTVTTSVGAP